VLAVQGRAISFSVSTFISALMGTRPVAVSDGVACDEPPADGALQHHLQDEQLAGNRLG
jgi:hypothetical protein